VVREREKAIIGAGLSLDLKGRRGRKVMADRRQLARAVGNLLDNAIAATAEGGRILIELPKPLESDDWSAAIILKDNGSGMSKTDLSRALDGLAKGSDGRIERRSGLGLPLTRQLIEAHGGTLTIESREGAGTTATIRLP
jgi:signal transduction histidine kinase